jgi:small conductance mechanosensitive channel
MLKNYKYYKDNILFKYIYSIVIIIISFYLGNFLKKFYLSQVITKIKNKNLAYEIIGNFISYTILFFGIIYGLTIIGFNISTILVVIGSFGITIALALQTTLTHLISGLFILFYGYFEINDVVEINGTVGYVKDFNLFKTYIADSSNHITVISNNDFINKSFTNYTLNKTFLYNFSIDISSINNIDYNILMNNIKTKIKNESKYCIDKNNIDVIIQNMSTLGTTILIKVPINSSDFFVGGAELKQIVRTLLTDDNILLLDNSYFTNINSNKKI